MASMEPAAAAMCRAVSLCAPCRPASAQNTHYILLPVAAVQVLRSQLEARAGTVDHKGWIHADGLDFLHSYMLMRHACCMTLHGQRGIPRHHHFLPLHAARGLDKGTRHRENKRNTRSPKRVLP